MHNIFNICSEGGTGENRRIDPHLNVGILEKTIIIFGKNWFRSSPRLKFFSDPHLDEIRSALTVQKYRETLCSSALTQFFRLIPVTYSHIRH